ncbi:MAG: hypothetical protein ISS88_01640 [Candidatus Portnoybacteria bacterium]|nr:hypothetical protein [Candidatus Portnoybacteria bacterium]
MELEELKKKIYKPGAEFEERLKSPEVFQPGRQKEKKSPDEWKELEKRGLSPQQKKYWLIGSISAIVIFLAVAGLFFWRGLTSFDKDKVKLEIKGAERIISGEEIIYLIKYQNQTRLDLTKVKLVFHYPDQSIPLETEDLVQTIDLPDLAVGQENQIELPVRVIGLQSETKKAWAELSYQPGKITSTFTNQAEFSTKIISVPLILDLDLPNRLVSGQSFNFSLKYLNQGEVSFDNLQIQLDYPAGFTFQTAEPPPLEEDRIWFLGDLMAGQEGKIFIQGNIQGEEGQNKSFQAQLGLFKEEQFTPMAETVSALQISLSPLSVSQTVNGTTDYITQAGQKLTYQIDYENTTDVGIRDVNITSKLESPALDLTSLELKEGSFDGASQTITWKASNLPALGFLGPYQIGQLTFSVKVKDPLPIANYSDKNFKIINTVKIDSSQPPLSLKDIEIAGQSQTITKVASQITLQAKGYYSDDLIPNSGPIPPRVGQTTTYTIKWRLISTTNDLDRVKIEASLPPHVQWQNKISPTNADLEYDSQTGRLVWQVDDLPAATGILLPVKQVAFQVAITPGLAHLGSFVELIGQSKATGHDIFVNMSLESISPVIDTELPDDPTTSRRDGLVVE